MRSGSGQTRTLIALFDDVNPFATSSSRLRSISATDTVESFLNVWQTTWRLNNDSMSECENYRTVYPVRGGEAGEEVAING